MTRRAPRPHKPDVQLQRATPLRSLAEIRNAECDRLKAVWTRTSSDSDHAAWLAARARADCAQDAANPPAVDVT